MEERTDIIDHLKDFNILTTQLLSVEAKIEEDQALLILTSSPLSYDILVTILVGNENLIRTGGNKSLGDKNVKGAN